MILDKYAVVSEKVELKGTEKCQVIVEKGKIVESDIRPMIRNFDLLDVQDNVLTLEATIATGSKANLNTNIFIPKILDLLELDMDPLDVDILRRDLYKLQDGQLVSPM